MKPEADRLLTTDEVAGRLNVRPRTVRRLIRKQQITARRIGSYVLIDETAVTAFIEASTVPAHPEWEGGPHGI
jgi:excisionase family DNA binding protein